MADNSLLLAKYIQSVLEESEEIRTIIGNDDKKIFTLQMPDTLTYPFIWHMRAGLTVTYTKDIQFSKGWTNSIQYAVSCVSNDYIQALELANAVRHTLETFRWKTSDIHIHPIKLINVSEYSPEKNQFVEELLFQIDVD